MVASGFFGSVATVAATSQHIARGFSKQSLRRKAFIYLSYCGGKPPVDWYREIMEVMAPDVIVVPVFTVGPKDDPEALCHELRASATEYAKRMDWGWAP